MCPHSGLPARTTALPRGCLLSTRAGVRITTGALNCRLPAETPAGLLAVDQLRQRVRQRDGERLLIDLPGGQRVAPRRARGGTPAPATAEPARSPRDRRTRSHRPARRTHPGRQVRQACSRARRLPQPVGTPGAAPQRPRAALDPAAAAPALPGAEPPGHRSRLIPAARRGVRWYPARPFPPDADVTQHSA